jgi:penicillin amidase/acyl-homoserine-lactone acylase
MAQRPRHPLRFTFAALAVALGAAAAFLPAPPLPPRLYDLREAGQAHDVRVLRDEFGVPHVYGKTDADVAYGLAFAHAEDDFATLQGSLLAGRGKLASVYGKDAAPNDYLVSLLRVQDFVDAGYEKDLSPETRALCEAYAAGLNRYAALHPAAALPGLFPARGKDVVAGFVHKLPLFFGLERALTELMGETRRRGVSRKGEAAVARATVAPLADPPFGSNAFAVAPTRSADGFTRLSINSHQPWSGPVAWYEARLRSEEGWDVAGGLFPGTPLVLLGHNRELGWAHTVNEPDLVDVYVLETNPADPNQYRFDGEWRNLEVREAAIDVKLWRGLHTTVRRETLWSVHGPVLRRPHGTYALRFANLGDIRMVEQWYRMNKAKSQEEWRAAFRLGALPMFNTVYADRAGNVAYIYNARLPRRAAGYDWSAYLPGDTSETLWSDYLPWDELPQVSNPPSGVVFNANSTPFEATLGEGNPDPDRYPPSLGIERHLTNRALRLQELLGADSAISREDVDRIKMDAAYSRRSSLAKRLATLLAGPPPLSPVLQEALQAVGRWDLRADASDPHAALAILTLRPRFDNRPPPVDRSDLLTALEHAADRLETTFGRTDVPWGEVLRLRRGRLDLPLAGGPDALRAVYSRPAADGRLEGFAGDCFVMHVEWDPAGTVRSRSIHQFGSATLDPHSPHFADQAPLFARQEWKPVRLEEADLRAHLVREYRPGQVER